MEDVVPRVVAHAAGVEVRCAPLLSVTRPVALRMRRIRDLAGRYPRRHEATRGEQGLDANLAFHLKLKFAAWV